MFHQCTIFLLYYDSKMLKCCLSTPGTNLINKCQSGVITQLSNKALLLGFTSHMMSFNQSKYIVSE